MSESTCKPACDGQCQETCGSLALGTAVAGSEPLTLQADDANSIVTALLGQATNVTLGDVTFDETFKESTCAGITETFVTSFSLEETFVPKSNASATNAEDEATESESESLVELSANPSEPTEALVQDFAEHQEKPVQLVSGLAAALVQGLAEAADEADEADEAEVESVATSLPMAAMPTKRSLDKPKPKRPHVEMPVEVAASLTRRLAKANREARLAPPSNPVLPPELAAKVDIVKQKRKENPYHAFFTRPQHIQLLNSHESNTALGTVLRRQQRLLPVFNRNKGWKPLLRDVGGGLVHALVGLQKVDNTTQYMVLSVAPSEESRFEREAFDPRKMPQSLFRVSLRLDADCDSFDAVRITSREAKKGMFYGESISL